VSPVDVELAQARLVDLLPQGWSEIRSVGRAELITWVPASDEREAITTLGDALDEVGIVSTVTGARERADWRDGLRRHHHPIDVAGRLRVRPPWTDSVEGRLDVVIDPGMAFGTGQHATTRGCLDCLLDVPPGGVVDVGCGSGVLAIAARRLGHDPVIGIDHDPLSVEATTRNAAANGVQIDVRLADATGSVVPDADTVIANITRRHVIDLASHLTRPPRTAILSGFVPDDIPSVVEAWSALGLRVAREIVDDGWAALRLERG